MDMHRSQAQRSPHSRALSKEGLRDYVVSHLAEALDKGWVVPYYQPVVRTLTGKLCGLEALARWDDPTYGLLAPDQFIPALEEARLIHMLDCNIVRQVCRQYHQSASQGEHVVPISLNLSRLDFDYCDIYQVVEEATREYGVPRRMINIEITETVFGTNPEYMAVMTRKFQDAGYQVWMDDFGSGYSTLNALKDFDFDELKIDMEFLNRFGEKSKVILASVVDMAKKLGIQTLAEGVETEEHRTFLRRIGCEKMQGYLFGKPLPYYHPDTKKLVERIGVESTPERLYITEVGAMNTLSLSERDFTAGNSTKGYVTSMSLATVEYANGAFNIVDSNRVFRESLANIGILSLAEVERRVNDESHPFARHAHQLVSTLERDKFARIDHVVGDIACVIRAKHITTRNGKTAMLVSIDDSITQSERRRHDRMDEVLAVMYKVYEHVDIIHLDDEYLEPIFGNIGLQAQFEESDFAKVTDHFAETMVYPLDRARYKRFMDHDTIIERIDQSGNNHITSFFRLREGSSEYSWKMFGLIHLSDQPGNQVMLCIRGTHWTHNGILQAAYDNTSDAKQTNVIDADFSMTDGSLWRALMRETNVCLFWKDAECRFVGANRSFLDYFGFESVTDIVGKTDEDMGWHIDSTPFEESELRILNEGVTVNNIAGQCIVHGEVHDVVSNKSPVYRNGRIVGIVGYFIDVEERKRGAKMIEQLSTRDAATGTLNYIGLESATWQYVDAYRRKGVDFAMVSINIENFQSINSAFGSDFGDKVLARIGQELMDIAGNNRVVGHVYADRFVILVQNESDEALEELCENVERRISSISDVDGTPCTVYAMAGFARFSQHQDIEAMKRYNRDRRLERRERWHGSSGSGGDVITSSLL